MTRSDDKILFFETIFEREIMFKVEDKISSEHSSAIPLKRRTSVVVLAAARNKNSFQVQVSALECAKQATNALAGKRETETETETERAPSDVEMG